jgi:formylglycine-generating enzyme required for sulfatase activity
MKFRNVVFTIIAACLLPINASSQNTVRDEAKKHVEQGAGYFEQNKFDSALTEFNKAVELDPKSLLAYHSRAHFYFEQEDYERAIADFAKSIELDPQDAELYGDRGSAYLKARQLSSAHADFTKAIRIDPKFGPAYYYRAAIYIADKRYDLALADATKLIQLDPALPRHYENRAEVYRLLGKADLAAADEKTAEALSNKSSVNAAGASTSLPDTKNVKNPPSAQSPAGNNLKAGATVAGKVITNPFGMKFIGIPAGTFQMGSKFDENQQPGRTVTIKNSFYMGRTEVTQGEYQAVMGANPSLYDNCGKDCPVERISWKDAKEFIRRLNAKKDGFVYSLPTEAEWEYAAGPGVTGNDYEYFNKTAWYLDYSTHPVALKQPNAFGIYDTTGNVWEFCEDVYQEGYNGLPSDGSANLTKGDLASRVIRGGSWGSDARTVLLARGGVTLSERNDAIGFRVVARPRLAK